MARRIHPDKWLFAATVGLALFGVVMVYSASAIMALRENNNQFYYVIKQGVWTGIGFVAMLGAMHVDYRHWKSRRIVYVLLSITILMLLVVFGFGKVNGAHRWIRFWGFSIQPSEISKVTLAIFLAYIFESRAGEERDFWRTFLPCGLITAAIVVLVV